MRNDHDKAPDPRTVLGSKVNEKVVHLLSEIEKEPVPDRLLDLALQLQKALNEKLDGDRS